MRSLTNTMICWNPGGDVALFDWPDADRASRQYQRANGACNSFVQYMDFEQRKLLVFTTAIMIIVRDNCDPQAVHQALLGLEEYASELPGGMLPEELLAMRREWEGE